jgi:Arc/MetJ-type ribon-helix-helix transcriptional regulator
MKLSVSLTDEDVSLLDEYVRSAGLASRSAAIQHAVRMLRHPELEENYAAAWQEWESADDAAVWETTVGDGLPRAEG